MRRRIWASQMLTDFFLYARSLGSFDQEFYLSGQVCHCVRTYSIARFAFVLGCEDGNVVELLTSFLTHSMASTALNMATDLVIACLPLPVLNKLQLPSRQKYALMGVFALAGLVIIISILRLPSLIKLWETKDTSYQNPMVMIWSSVEINVGIICSCLPTLRCLFPRLFKAATGYASGRSTGFSDGSRSGGGGKDRNKQDRKSQGYAYVCKSNSGQGSFGGKFSSKVSISTVNKSLVEKTSRRTKDPQLLECVEEIEMGCAKDDQSVTTDAPRGRCDVNLGQIVVRTDIEQVAHVKSSANASRRGTKDSGTLERELV